MRAKLWLKTTSLFEAVLWCRRNSVPILVAKSYRHGPTKWIGKVFYFGSKRILQEVIGRDKLEPESKLFNGYFVVVRPGDFDLIKLRFGRLNESWRDD